MPQGFGLYPDLSVQENLEFFADLHGLAAEVSAPRIRDMLERAGLMGFETRRAGNLSGGMMQKLALSCALISQPRVMFLDEATTGVDPVSRRAFWRLLDGVREDGVAILYATANITGAGARAHRARFGAIPGVRLAFPVGRQVNLWVDADRDPGAFQHDLDEIAPGLKAEPMQPSLQDAALRDMSLRASEERNNGQRHGH